MKESKKGISLITLVVTIVVIIIIATVVILTLNENNPVGRAREATFKSDLKTIEEEYAMYISNKSVESEGRFKLDSLSASEKRLEYNTKEGVEGNIYEVIPSAKKKYEGEFEIIKGELYYKGQVKEKLIWAKEVGIGIIPYEIIEGELVSSNVNIELVTGSGKIVIPSNVEVIGEGAFSNVEGLKEVVIPGTVKEIKKNAFANNSTLEKVVIEEGVEKIGEDAFYSCKNLKEVEIADSVIDIDAGTFMICSNLEKINIPNNLKVIPAYFIYNCSKIEDIIIPDAVTTISSGAFAYTNISSINIPKNVTNIGGFVFEACNNLEEINIDKGNSYYKYEDGILYSINEGEVKFIANSKLNSEIFEFPYGVKIANLGGEISNSKIKVIKIPETVMSMDFNCLKNMSKLQDIQISEENKAYQKIGNGIYSKDENNKILYYYFKGEKNVVLEEGIKQIASFAFANNKELESIELPDSLIVIGNQAFSGCSKLKNIKVGPNVSNIDGISFYGIPTDSNIEISPANNYYIFENGMLLTKDRKELVRVITNNEEVEIPNGIEVIGDYAFHNCTKLKNVVIPSTVKKIGQSFNYCSALERIEIPSSIESISSNCFDNSLNLKEIVIHKKKGEIAGSPWGCIYGDRGVIWDE